MDSNILGDALNNIVQFFRGSPTVVKNGPQMVASQYVSKPQANPSDYQAPTQPTPAESYQAPAQATATQDYQVNPWEQMGRPSTNPYTDLLLKVFGPDLAPQAEQVLRWGTPSYQGKYGVDYGGENLGYNPESINYNENGSTDIGLFPINSGTYQDFASRMGEVLSSLGITNYKDLYNPELNAQMAKLIQEQQGWGAFYGAPESLRGQ